VGPRVRACRLRGIQRPAAFRLSVGGRRHRVVRLYHLPDLRGLLLEWRRASRRLPVGEEVLAAGGPRW